jgi:hypothetical protein
MVMGSWVIGLVYCMTTSGCGLHVEEEDAQRVTTGRYGNGLVIVY